MTAATYDDVAHDDAATAEAHRRNARIGGGRSISFSLQRSSSGSFR